ncbi:MAG TPA: AbrB/MazE/SpoVT family DNA-binding domain-containing protein [Stellaceae bacterium]
MIAKAKINNQGRIVLPAECREAAGMAPGAEVMVEVVGVGELRLRTKAEAIRKAQAIVARYIPKDRDLVSELIVERRKEAARE